MIDTTAQYILFFSLFLMVNMTGPHVQAAEEVEAAEEVDPLPVTVEPPVEVMETWHLDGCDWTGRRDGAQLVKASGMCGQIKVFAGRVNRDPVWAEDIVIAGPFGVVSAASATWPDNGFHLVDGALQALGWTMKSQTLFVDFSSLKVVLESPNVGEKG